VNLVGLISKTRTKVGFILLQRHVLVNGVPKDKPVLAFHSSTVSIACCLSQHTLLKNANGIYCYMTITVVTRTRQRVTLCVHWLCC